MGRVRTGPRAWSKGSGHPKDGNSRGGGDLSSLEERPIREMMEGSGVGVYFYCDGDGMVMD